MYILQVAAAAGELRPGYTLYVHINTRKIKSFQIEILKSSALAMRGRKENHIDLTLPAGCLSPLDPLKKAQWGARSPPGWEAIETAL